MTLPLSLYRGVSSLARPFLKLHLKRRARRGKEDPARLGERLGAASVDRPAGHLVWIHAASVGESLSALPLIDAMKRTLPEHTVLMTTGTVTSAHLIGVRAPQVLHQYVPADMPSAVGSFLDHWKPDLALWMESEIWPNLLTKTVERGVPSALVNGRISKTSTRNWRKVPATAKTLLSAFDLRLAQSEAVAERMRELGAPDHATHVTGDLKASRKAEPADPEALSEMREHIGSRPIWLAASTHPGEEDAVMSAHEALAVRAPDVLTIIAPRHPERGDEIEALARTRDLSVTRRSKNEPPSGAVYIADTLGEMPLWYALARIAYVGAGWGDLGGHNPLEPAQARVAVLSGPKVANFEKAYADLDAAGALRFVDDGDALARVLCDLTDEAGHPNAAALQMAEAGAVAGEPDPRPLEKTMQFLQPLFDRAFR